MEYRVRKQIIISTIFVFLLALIGTGIYFGYIYQAPTCSDGIKNQNEEEIDCGGLCQSCVPIKDIEIIWTKAIPAGDGVWDLAAEIKNPNNNFGVSDLHYSFVAKDATGQVLGKKDGVAFILSNNSRYLIEANFASGQQISSLEVQIEKIEKSRWEKLKNFQAPDIFVTDKKFTVLDPVNYSAEASGTVQNNSDFDFDKVLVDIVLFDADNQIIGVSKTDVRTLVAGEGRYFSVKWFSPFSGAVGSIDMRAQTNLFSDDNFMRKYGAPGEEIL